MIRKLLWTLRPDTRAANNTDRYLSALLVSGGQTFVAVIERAGGFDRIVALDVADAATISAAEDLAWNLCVEAESFDENAQREVCDEASV